MRNLLLLSVAALLYLTGRTQDSLLYSDTFRFGRNMSGLTCITQKQDLFLTIEEFNTPGFEIEVRALDEHGKSKDVFTHRWPGPENEKLSIAGVLPLSDRALIFLTGYNRKEDMQNAYVVALKNQGKTADDPLPILSAHTSADSPLHWSLSPDSTRIAAFFESFPGKRIEQTIHLIAFTPELETLWERELSLPYGSELAQVHQCTIDDSASVYLLSGKNPAKSNTAVLRSSGGRYLVFHYNHENNKLKEFDISLKDKQVVAAKGKINANNEMIVAGFYSNDYSFSTAGTFMFRISPDGPSLQSASYMALPEDLLVKAVGSREAQRMPEIPDLYLDHLFIENNEVTMIGEKYVINERIYMDPATGRTVIENVHYYEDIIVIRSDTDGKIKWTSWIPKIQYSSFERDRCSYNAYFYKDGCYLFYNDHPDNIKSTKDFTKVRPGAWNGSRSASLIEIKIQPDGTQNKKEITTFRNAEGWITPGLSTEQTFGRPFIGIAYNRDYRFLIID